MLDHLLLRLRSAYAVAFFWQPYAMSQRLFPSRVAFIFGRDFVLMTGESNHSFSLFQHIPKTFNGVKVRTLWWPIHVWNIPKLSGKKKSIDGITWSFSTFSNSADLQCLDMTNWSNPQIITMQFADLNRNGNFRFWPGSVYYAIIHVPHDLQISKPPHCGSSCLWRGTYKLVLCRIPWQTKAIEWDIWK